MVLLISRRYAAIAAVLALCIGGMFGILWFWQGSASIAAAGRLSPDGARLTVVLDPGHGGEDGGAVAADGTVESSLNLEIARRTELLLRFLGQKTVMTRRDDRSIYSDGAETLHEKKVSDLKNRVALVNQESACVLISIHQNMLPGSSRTHGAQVFFNEPSGADALAQSVQDLLNQTINVGCEKACRPISKQIYLMKHVTAPAILIECGFLSNPDETALLKTKQHQLRLAAAVSAGYFLARSGTGEDHT